VYIIQPTAGEVTNHKTSRTSPHTFPISAEDGGCIEFPRAHEAIRGLADKTIDISVSESSLIALLTSGQHRLRVFQKSISKKTTKDLLTPLFSSLQMDSRYHTHIANSYLVY